MKIQKLIIPTIVTFLATIVFLWIVATTRYQYSNIVASGIPFLTKIDRWTGEVSTFMIIGGKQGYWEVVTNSQTD